MRPRNGIYITSKIRHAEKWRTLREEGCPIISSWIDMEYSADPSYLATLWDVCISECKQCAVLVVYKEEGEVLKGGLVEVGAAIASGAKIFVVGPVPEMGTVIYDSSVERVDDLMAALEKAISLSPT